MIFRIVNGKKKLMADVTPQLAPVALSGNYEDLSNKPNIFDGNYNNLTNKPTIPPEYSHPLTHPASMITGLVVRADNEAAALTQSAANQNIIYYVVG